MKKLSFFHTPSFSLFQNQYSLPMFLPSTPAHYIILLAAERIGTAIICRDDIPEELCFAIRKSKSNTAFVMDYT